MFSAEYRRLQSLFRLSAGSSGRADSHQRLRARISDRTLAIAAYEVAQERCPLLFVGEDFSRTDLRSALRWSEPWPQTVNAAFSAATLVRSVPSRGLEAESSASHRRAGRLAQKAWISRRGGAAVSLQGFQSALIGHDDQILTCGLHHRFQRFGIAAGQAPPRLQDAAEAKAAVATASGLVRAKVDAAVQGGIKARSLVVKPERRHSDEHRVSACLHAFQANFADAGYRRASPQPRPV